MFSAEKMQYVQDTAKTIKKTKLIEYKLVLYIIKVESTFTLKFKIKIRQCFNIRI